MARMDITKETGTTADSIARHLLHNEKLDDVPKQYRVRLEDWIINENGKSEYELSTGIKVPDEVDILGIALQNIPSKRKGDGQTEIPLPIKGWRLIKDEGKLKQVDTGWLTDEKELYILKDGRRVTEAEANKNENGGLRFGTETDPEKGLKEILGAIPSEGIKTEYESINLLNDASLFNTMPVVVFQALQINVCYETQNERLFNNIPFYSIGTDETNIPIVITEITGKGSVSPRVVPTSLNRDHGFGSLKKLVIAGPHGNERNALFAVLETQKHFIKEVNSVPQNLILYFAPAISPTFFFADARGLPLNEKGGFSANFPTVTMKKNAVNVILKGYKIPTLHDEIIRSFGHYRNGKVITFQDKIQDQGDSTEPGYGIDTNRDVYDLLPSTRFFLNFIDTRASRGVFYDNITVFMLHGYEDINKERIPPGERVLNSQGTVAGPYRLDGIRGYMEESVMNRVDNITSSLFGYKYARGSAPINRVNYSRNYFFDPESTVDIVGRKFNGEWSRKLYLNEKDGHARRIQCFDIELPENYREGSRCPPGETGKHGIYTPNMVVNRHTYNIKMPFFNEAARGKFLNDPSKTTSSFYDFLLEYFDLRDRPLNTT